MPPAHQPPTRDQKLFDEFADTIDAEGTGELDQLIDAGADPNVCSNRGQSPVLYAVRFAKPEMVGRLLEAGGNPDAADEDNWSPLVQAAHDDRPDLVELLISHGADPNLCPNEVAPLAMAIGHSQRSAMHLIAAGADLGFRSSDAWPLLMKAVNVKAAKLIGPMLDAGADPAGENPHGWNAATLATYLGHDDIAAEIRAAGGEVDEGRLALFDAIEAGDLQRLGSAADLEARDPWGKTPLIWVCSRQEAATTLRPVFDFLMGAEVDLDAEDDEGLTALIYAAEGDDDLVEILLAAGAGAKGGRGWSALHTACRSGSLALTRALLERRANPNQKDQEKRTPIVWAAVQGYDAIVRMLIEAGAKVDAAGRDRVTALIAASGKGHLEVVETLLAAGADTDLCDYGLKRTALHHACHEDPAIVERLLDAGADPLLKTRSGATPVAESYQYRFDCALPIQWHLTKMAMDRAIGSNPGHPRLLAMKIAGLRSIATLTDWVATGNLTMVRDLLGIGVSPNQYGAGKMRPLTEAVRHGHTEIVRALLEAGADPDDSWGDSALQFALQEPRTPDIIRMLLEAGAETHTIDPIDLEPYREPKAVAKTDPRPDQGSHSTFAAQFGDFDRAKIQVTQDEFDQIAERHFREFQAQLPSDSRVDWERLYIERPDDEVQLLHGPPGLDTSAQANLRRVTLDGIVAQQVYLDASNWSHSVLRDCQFAESNFHHAMFSRGSLSGSQFSICGFDHCDFSQRSLSESSFDSCRFRQADFGQTNLERVTFTGCSMWEVDFTGAVLVEVTFERCDLRASNLRGATLERCRFKACNLTNVRRSVARWTDC